MGKTFQNLFLLTDIVHFKEGECIIWPKYRHHGGN
jgi:hypothetical protein